MNILVFDPPARIAHLAKALLRAEGHRVALACEVAEAISKIDTALFDALVLGPEGAPRELADFVEREFPHLPIVLAGAADERPPDGKLVAVLPAPISSARLLGAVRRVEGLLRERLAQLPVELVADGVSIACRLAALTPETMVLAGDSDAFHRYLGSAPRRVQACVSGHSLGGEVQNVDSNEFRRVRTVNVRLEGADVRDLRAKLVK